MPPCVFFSQSSKAAGQQQLPGQQQPAQGIISGLEQLNLGAGTVEKEVDGDESPAIHFGGSGASNAEVSPVSSPVITPLSTLEGAVNIQKTDPIATGTYYKAVGTAPKQRGSHQHR